MKRFIGVLASAAMACGLSMAVAPAPAIADGPVKPAPPPAAAPTTQPACGTDGFITGWLGSMSDAGAPIDANFRLTVPLSVTNQTFRMVITPNISGDQVKVRLSNRKGFTPVTFGHVTVAKQTQGAGVEALHDVTFGGQRSLTLAPGADAFSDPVPLPATAFQPLSVSMHVLDSGSPSKHWNANATGYYSPAGAGDLTTNQTGQGLLETTTSWFWVDALAVAAAPGTHTVVAFGDSITDGWVAATRLGVPADPAVNDKNQRYPDYLARRVAEAGLPISVVNAGIGANRVVTDGPTFIGDAGQNRFRRDALELPGVTGVLILEGINDLGIPRLQIPITPDPPEVIAAYTSMISQAHAVGKKAWLATITPASNSLVVDGTNIAPQSNNKRNEINHWIRTNTLADGYVDFDLVIRDPSNPANPNPMYASIDNLHMSPVGYEKMADTVPLEMLARGNATC